MRALDEAKFFPFAAKLFSRQVEFFDAHVWDMSRAQIYDALVEIASEFVDAAAMAARSTGVNGSGRRRIRARPVRATPVSAWCGSLWRRPRRDPLALPTRG